MKAVDPNKISVYVSSVDHYKWYSRDAVCLLAGWLLKRGLIFSRGEIVPELSCG